MMWKRLTDAGPSERTLELLLRIGVAGCFVGHGAFGIIGKEAWLPYFAVAGIGPEWAWRLMPVVGSVDIAVGVLALLAPRPAFLGYAAFWAVWAALLRPLAGESFFETLERAGNYGVPIAFLLLAGAGFRPTVAWLKTIDMSPMTPSVRRDVMLALRATTATLLLGHGGLALSGKPLLARHVQAAGLPEDALALIGVFEIALAVAVAVRPAAALLLTVLGWKLVTEAFFPITGDPFWEFVERAGSYIAPLALWTMVRSRSHRSSDVRARAATAAVVLFAAGLTSGATVGAAPPVVDSSARRQSEELLARLQQGGFVLACRHAITDRSRGDARRVDFEDRSTQRLLSAEGETQARRLGEILARQRIPIGEVLTSPYFRTADSARLTFGRAEVSEALYGRSASRDRELRELLTDEPEPGTNRALMTHQGILYRVFTELERGSIREGDCVVVEPGDGSFEVLARLGPDEWEVLR